MKTLIAKNIKSGNIKAFELIRKQILAKPDSLIALAVGKTTDGLYELMNKDSKKNPKFWAKIKLFQIDENLGLAPNSPLSFNNEIRRELDCLLKVLNKKNVYLIDGRKNPKTIISEGYRFIKKNQGIDLITLGIGPEYDPHIAYNTTGKSKINSGFRSVPLHPKEIAKIKNKALEIQKNKKQRVTYPAKGITIGVKDILQTKSVLLIAYGKDKAKSLHIAFKKIDMKKASASALLLHKKLIVITDKAAGKLLSKD